MHACMHACVRACQCAASPVHQPRAARPSPSATVTSPTRAPWRWIPRTAAPAPPAPQLLPLPSTPLCASFLAVVHSSWFQFVGEQPVGKPLLWTSAVCKQDPGAMRTGAKAPLSAALVCALVLACPVARACTTVLATPGPGLAMACHALRLTIPAEMPSTFHALLIRPRGSRGDDRRLNHFLTLE